MIRNLIKGWHGRRVAWLLLLAAFATAAVLVARRSLTNPAIAADEALKRKVQAQLGPTPGRPALPAPGSSGAYLPREDLQAYWQHVGSTKSADDNDATWAYQIARDHPDHQLRRFIIVRSGVLLSEGRVGQALRSELSESWRGEIIKLIAEFAASPQLEDRGAALTTLGVDRLWRIKPLDEVFEKLGAETDPQMRKSWLTAEPEFRRWKAAGAKGG